MLLEDFSFITKEFVNRTQELTYFNQLQQRLLDHTPRHVALIGARRLGKSYLLFKYLYESSSPTIIPLYIDTLYKRNWAELSDDLIHSLLENYRYCTKKSLHVDRFNTWLKGTFQEIVNRLQTIETEVGTQAGTYVKLRASLKEQPENEIQLIQTSLKSLEEFAEKKKISLIVVFDEFQHIEKFKDMEETLAAMRAIIQVQRHIQYIFCGSSTTFMNNIFTKSTSAFWRQVDIVHLEPFTLDAVNALAKARNLSLSTTEKQVLHHLTRGIPDYLVKTIEKISTQKKKEKDIIPTAFDELVKQETPLFSDLFERLPDLQQQVIISLAEGKHQYHELEKDIGRKVGGILNQMLYAQLIERSKKGWYDIFDPVFKASIQQRIQ